MGGEEGAGDGGGGYVAAAGFVFSHSAEAPVALTVVSDLHDPSGEGLCSFNTVLW